MFKLSNVTRVIRNAETSGESPAGIQGSHLDFTPSEVTQGVGVLDSMRAEAEIKQASEEETGSVSSVETEQPVVDETAKEEPTVDDPTKTPEIAAKEVSDTFVKGEDGSLSYKGVPVTVTNTPEMVEAFKDKELDIDAVNSELYSAEGLTEATRTKLNEAFGKMSVDMYLEGLSTKNEALVNEYNANQTKNEAAMDAVTAEATGGKFDEVMKWANDNLDDKQYSAYAEIINGDNEFQVKLALKDLTARSGIQSTKLDQPIVTPKVVEQVLSADVVTKDETSNAITAIEYRTAITSREYNKDMKGWDARRQAGIDQGI